MKNKFGHLDQNHKEICKELRAKRFWVAETSGQGGFVDCVVADGQIMAVAEIKRSNGTFDLHQLETLAKCPNNACFFFDAKQAVETMRERRFLTPKQKSAILDAVYLKRFEAERKGVKRPQISLKTVMEILESN